MCGSGCCDICCGPRGTESDPDDMSLIRSPPFLILNLLQGCRTGYQAYISLFMAPASYDLSDYLFWASTDAIASQQLAWARVRIYPTIDYTWANLHSSVNDTYKEFGSNGRMSQVQS